MNRRNNYICKLQNDSFSHLLCSGGNINKPLYYCEKREYLKKKLYKDKKKKIFKQTHNDWWWWWWVDFKHAIKRHTQRNEGEK